MIYCNILSEKYIVALGANIADQIRVVLMGKAVITDQLVEFIPPDTAPQYVTGIGEFLLLIYLRMRGKDFGMKLLQKNAALKSPVWKIQTILSDPKHRIKAQKK